MLEQKVTQGKKLTLHIPLKWGLVAKSGQELARGIIHLKEKKQKLSVDHIESECLLSINRNFSAPIILKQERPLEELALMMMYDKDEFNRWDAAQNLYSQILVGCTKDLAKKKKITIPAQLRESFKILLSDNKIDHAFKSLSLTFPSETQINDLLEQPDYDHVHLARKQLARMLTDDNQNLVSDIYQTLDQDKKFELTPEAMGKRSLKNKMLGMIYYSSHTQAMELTLKQFHEATNMTDEMGAFSLLVESQSAEANAAIEAFYQKWSSDFLVMNKWFAAQASATRGDILEVVKKLESHPKFDKKNPNMLRSLYGSFAGNIYNFNKSDGSGYEFIGSRISEIDEYNPQVAARFAGLFNRYKKVDKKRQKLMGAVCEKILKKTSLSKDTFEILTKTLES